MKLLIFVSMVIIFISCFFMFFIFDTMIMTHIECLSDLESSACNLPGMATSFMVGIFMIAMFVLVDILVIYILIKTLTSKSAITYIPK